MEYRFLIFFSVFLFCFTGGHSQTGEVTFTPISQSNGISIGKINGMTQDKYGFMWFSDQTFHGIIRYDGTHMTRYQYDANHPEGLGGYYPECLYADDSGVIWIGFYGMGLDRFDPLTNEFTHYRHDPNDPASLSDDFVSAVRVDHLGNLWVGTNGGLDLFDPQTSSFKHYQHDENDPTSLSFDEVRAIYEDREGALWVGTGFALNAQRIGGGLNRFNRESKTFTRFLHEPDNPNSLLDSKVRAIFEDSKGNFWIGSGKNGLHLMDRETGLFERYIYDPANPGKLSAPPSANPGDHITFITEDSDHHLWIGTHGEGLNRYDPKTKMLTHYGAEAGTASGFLDNSGWWVHATDDGILWLSTQEASLYKVDVFGNNIPHYTRFNGVSCFYEESPGVIWMGTNSGLVREDLKDGTIKQFINDLADPNSLSNNFVTKIIKDHRGYFWIGTFNGLNRFNPSTTKFSRYLYEPNDGSLVNEYSIYDLYEDNELKLWIGTDRGLMKLDPITENFTFYDENVGDSTALTRNLITSLAEDDRNRLWIGTGRSGGLNRFNRATGTFSRFLTGFDINTIYVDTEGVIWVGTPNGLFMNEPGSEEFRKTDIESSVNGIITGNDGNLFLSTSSGIIKSSRDLDQKVVFGKANGVNGDAFFGGPVGSKSAVKLHDGKILFGTVFGYHAFYPNLLVTLPKPSRIYFTNFWLNSKPVISGDDGPLKTPIYEAREIKLDHNQDVFALNFTEVDYRNTGENTMYYMLENYDTDWRQALPEQRVNYFKVPPGEYNFKIKAANNNNGLWSEKSLLISIAPPWWNTWWAYGLYLVFFACGVIAVHTIQKARVVRKERERSQKKELEQAKEIEQAYTELKSTQAQLIHAEKMASLGELTAGIAHEIQNPLNFVNNFSDVNKELAEELAVEIEKGNLDEAKALAKDIINNEEKIVHHGRRAEEIVRSMLQHSRGSEGKKELTDINALADEYLRLAYHGMRAKDKSFNVTMDTDLDPGLPKINVVPQDIGRVILNLITNAFFAVSAKAVATADSEYKPAVWVGTQKDGYRIQITVKDNGTGIPKDIIDKIFQPFFSTKSTGQGTGLGLSLSYDIITKGHGGSIEVQSTEEKGTEFKILLPS